MFSVYSLKPGGSGTEMTVHSPVLRRTTGPGQTRRATFPCRIFTMWRQHGGVEEAVKEKPGDSVLIPALPDPTIRALDKSSTPSVDLSGLSYKVRFT